MKPSERTPPAKRINFAVHIIIIHTCHTCHTDQAVVSQQFARYFAVTAGIVYGTLHHSSLQAAAKNEANVQGWWAPTTSSEGAAHGSSDSHGSSGGGH